MHSSSYEKMARFVEKYLDEKEAVQTVLDFGSRDVNGSYRARFAKGNWVYVGLDLEAGENVDLVPKNPYKWEEVPNESIDVLISGQALEHTEFFWVIFEEIKRVLKPDGLCCVIAPSAGPEHRHPQDCWRFYPDGMRALCKHADLICLEATTEWEPRAYADGSEQWKDTVLIARKSPT